MQRPQIVVSAGDTYTPRAPMMRIPWTDGRTAELLYYPQYEAWEAVRSAILGTGGLVCVFAPGEGAGTKSTSSRKTDQSESSEQASKDQRTVQARDRETFPGESVWKGQENGRFYTPTDGGMREIYPMSLPAAVRSGSVSRPTRAQLESVLKTLTAEYVSSVHRATSCEIWDTKLMGRLTKLQVGSDPYKRMDLEFCFDPPHEAGNSSSESAGRGVLRLASFFSRRDTASSEGGAGGGSAGDRGDTAVNERRRTDDSCREDQEGHDRRHTGTARKPGSASQGFRKHSGSASASGSSSRSTDTPRSGTTKDGSKRGASEVLRIWVSLPNVLARHGEIAQPRWTQ